jgi:hypothetical protein
VYHFFSISPPHDRGKGNRQPENLRELHIVVHETATPSKSKKSHNEFSPNKDLSGKIKSKREIDVSKLMGQGECNDQKHTYSRR